MSDTRRRHTRKAKKKLYSFRGVISVLGIEPHAIEVASVLNRSVLECLALFVRINAELLKQRSERFRIDHTSLGGEILTEDAATFFSEAVL
jgi:hypothetical protein